MLLFVGHIFREETTVEVQPYSEAEYGVAALFSVPLKSSKLSIISCLVLMCFSKGESAIWVDLSVCKNAYSSFEALERFPPPPACRAGLSPM